MLTSFVEIEELSLFVGMFGRQEGIRSVSNNKQCRPQGYHASRHTFVVTCSWLRTALLNPEETTVLGICRSDKLQDAFTASTDGISS